MVRVAQSPSVMWVQGVNSPNHPDKGQCAPLNKGYKSSIKYSIVTPTRFYPSEGDDQEFVGLHERRQTSSGDSAHQCKR